MIYATKIRMRPGCRNSYNLMEIDQIYLDGDNVRGYYRKEAVHEYLITHPRSIRVNISSYPYLIPKLSIYNERYVASEPNYTPNDNLLRLPRE